jgi:hypothetical protein
MNFLQLAEKVIREERRPLTLVEIWEIGKKYKGTKGETPWITIGAQIYLDMKYNKKSIFERIDSNPIRFYLNTLPKGEIENKSKDNMVGRNTGFIYILENEAMKGLYKIGSSGRENLDKRIKDLNSTNMPFPFKCVFSCEVENYKEVEKSIHMAFNKFRVNPKREFFEIEPEQIIPLLKQLRIKDTTKSINEKIDKTIDIADKQAGKKYAKRRPSFKFKEMGINIGETISFVRDESKKATVIGGNLVEYGGKEYSLTELTSKLLGYIQAPLSHWKYKNKPLLEYYDETYGKEKFPFS